ncbi:MAG: DUF3089 domain-containing protein [Clostridia bacterium]|nr:DUF3089 domain-containing protein [Clostridia bacterium]
MYDNIKKRKIFCYFFSLLFSFIFNMNLAFGTELESTTTGTSASTETDNSNSGSAGTAIVEPEGDSDKSKTFTSSSTIAGVTIDIEADKDTYTLEDTAKFTVTLTNTNPYSVFVKDIRFGLPEYIEKQIIAALPEKLDKQGTDYGTVTRNIDVKLGFTQWVPVVLNNEQLKIGIKASLETISEDSKFVVSLVSESSGSDKEYHDLLSKFDKKDNIERICFFDFSITGQDASDVRELNGYAKLYIQIPKGWDEGQLETMFVADGNDENFEEKIEEVDGVKYLTFSTNHFSPYALFDPANIDQEMLESLSKDFMQTGHSDLQIILALISVAVISLIMALVFSNKFRKNMLSVILILNLCNIYMLASTKTTSNISSTQLDITFETVDSNGLSNIKTEVLPMFDAKSYKDDELWARRDPYAEIPEDETLISEIPISVFFIGPSIFDEAYENSVRIGNMSVFDKRMADCLISQTQYLRNSVDERLIDLLATDQETNGQTEKLGLCYKYYVPLYRMPTVPTYASPEFRTYFTNAYEDVKDAFENYLENIPQDYPCNLLVGFGTGAVLCDMLADDYKSDPRISGCLCVGLGRNSKPRSFASVNIACISNDETNLAKNEFLLADSFANEKELPNATKIDEGKLFDLATGKVLTKCSEHGQYIDIAEATGTAATMPSDDFPVIAAISKVGICDTDLLDMINKTEKYIGRGIYHLFDYQIFYKSMVDVIANFGLNYIV